MCFTSSLRAVRFLSAVLLVFTVTSAAAQSPGDFSLGTAFTYQGRLQQQGRPAEGRFDLSFELFDARDGGSSFGRIDRFDVAVSGGAFAAELDFGHAVFSGDPVWLEILVRPAGEGSYTALTPRHRLAGEGVGTCTVDSDVLVNGTLDVDPIGAVTGIEVTCCNEADLGGGGQVRLGGFLNDLLVDNNEIQARSLLEGGPFYLNPHGGNVGVGITSAQAPLHLPGAPDVALGTGGVLVLGSTTGANLALDQNEIMARNNGAPATLFLNNEGGTTYFGGPIDIRFQIVTVEGSGYIIATCPAGMRIIAGGCHTDDSTGSTPDALVGSFPSSDTTWTCHWDDSDDSSADAYAICAGVQ